MNKLPRDWKKLLNELKKCGTKGRVFFRFDLRTNQYSGNDLVLGDKDDIIVEHGLEMHRLIQGSQFCVLPNTTHEVFLRNQT